MKDRGLDPEKFSSIFKHSSTVCLHTEDRQPELKRFTARMLEIANVKEATMFPRDMNRIDNLLSRDE